MFAILQTIPGISFGNAMLSGTGADATSNASGTFGAMQVNGGIDDDADPLGLDAQRPIVKMHRAGWVFIEFRYVRRMP